MNKITLVTHSGPFHADDVFAAACIFLVYPDKEVELVRSRDEATVERADIVFDVGMIYDESKLRFDHHQGEGAGKRLNGLPYSSFGLVWKHFGLEVCKGDQDVWKEIDEKIVSPIDAIDNGVEIVERIRPEYPRPFTVQDVIKSMRPLWNKSADSDFDTAFMEAVIFARGILASLISFEESKKQARSIVEKAYREATDKRIVVLSQYVPWGDVLSEYPEPLFVVYPHQNGAYFNAKVVHDGSDEFNSNRINFPETWAGLRGQELEDVSGVEGAVFTHRGLFLSIAETKEAILEMIAKSLNN